jgi:transglutaminase-like putative cysteine protease
MFSGVGAFSLETASSLLILAFALKLVEMKSRRDAYLVIFLSYFIIATQFLFDQTILIAVYELAAIVVVTAAVVGLNQLHSRVRPLVSLKLATTLVLQALPFTIVLFLFFPRIAPLWTVPLPSAATSGISEKVTPGDISRLTQSDELAFRVVFDGEIPAARDRNWRGMVYSQFSQGTWSMGSALRRRPAINEPENQTRVYDYEVLLEPTMSNWLFAMDSAFPVADPKVRRTRDHRLEANDPVMSVFRYSVRTYPDALLDPTLGRLYRARETYLDGSDNPRIREFSEQLYRESGDTERFISNVLAHIRSRPFRYTLSPPLLNSTNSIDQFWFDTQAGFCTHYAGAFVYMMRAIGIPARLIGGYQGGEINPITNHLIVRQYDAHAWTEVWLPDRGWQRVDPTAAVAPDRIEKGLRAALSAADRATLSAFSNLRLGDWGLISEALLWVDSLEHRWNLWVVGYDSNFQANFIKKWLGELSPARMGTAMLVGGTLSLGFVAGLLFWRRRPVKQHPVERIFGNFADKLAGYGYQRRLQESPAAFVRRIASEVGLSEAQVGGVIAELDTLLYNPAIAWGNTELRALRNQLRRLQFRLAFGAAR